MDHAPVVSVLQHLGDLTGMAQCSLQGNADGQGSPSTRSITSARSSTP
jgi:hypothetical protein